MPGNHDRFRNYLGSSADPHFELVYHSPLWTPPSVGKVLEKDGVYLSVIAVDFCLHQDADAEPVVLVNRAGRGRVYDEVLEALIRETQTAVAGTSLAHMRLQSPLPMYENGGGEIAMERVFTGSLARRRRARRMNSGDAKRVRQTLRTEVAVGVAVRVPGSPTHFLRFFALE
jgi:hypothetical protein